MNRVPFLIVLLLAAAPPAAAFDPWEDEARYEFVYRVDPTSIEARGGQSVSLWIPLASDSPSQQVLHSGVEAPFEVEERRDGVGNRMLHVRWAGAAPAGASIVATTRVVRAPSKGIAHDAVAAGSRDDPQRYLGPHRRVPLDGLIGQLAVQESKGLDSDSEKIRAFYDYVVKNMRYAKEGEGWGCLLYTSPSPRDS